MANAFQLDRNTNFIIFCFELWHCGWMNRFALNYSTMGGCITITKHVFLLQTSCSMCKRLKILTAPAVELPHMIYLALIGGFPLFELRVFLFKCHFRYSWHLSHITSTSKHFLVSSDIAITTPLREACQRFCHVP